MTHTALASRATTRLTLGVSLVITLFLGCPFILKYWIASHRQEVGLVAACGFAVLMLLVHHDGYRLYRAQSRGRILVSPLYRKHLAFAAKFHAALILVPGLMPCILLISFPPSFVRFLGVGIVAYWASVGLIMARRPAVPTKSDIAILRAGVIFWLVLSIVMTVLARRFIA